MADCLIWDGAKAGNGYGTHRDQATGRMAYAHRTAFEACFGPIGPGQVVMHDCDTPSCYHPLHLRLGTQADNIADMVRKGRHSETRKTSCAHGHPLIGDNVKIETSGGRSYRRCLTCKRARERRLK